MTIIVDAGPLIALADRRDKHHGAVTTLLNSVDEDLVVSPFAIAEADFFVWDRLGQGAEMRLLADLSGGGFLVDKIDHRDVAECLAIMARYRDLGIGVTDASIAFLAERHRTRRIMTLDERHFRALRTAKGVPFILLPQDEPPAARKRRQRET